MSETTLSVLSASCRELLIAKLDVVPRDAGSGQGTTTVDVLTALIALGTLCIDLRRRDLRRLSCGL